MPKRKALDLFCGGGGVGDGLMRAGFEVTGVDRNKACEYFYPGEFVGGDVFEVAETLDLSEFDFIWASPPCQAFTFANIHHSHRKTVNDDLIEQTRELLAPYRYTCIENVVGAPIRRDLVLTGPVFGLDRIVRRRHFELGWMIDPDYQPYIWSTTPTGLTISITKTDTPNYDQRRRRRAKGMGTQPSLKECMSALGVSHKMSREMIGEAIPPAYAEYIAELALIYMDMDDAN